MQPIPLSDNKEKLFEQLIDLDNNIKNYNKTGWNYYEPFSYALAKLKRMYFIACFQCKPMNPDMFHILSCPKCVKASNGNNFFQDLKKHNIIYADGHINLF